MYYKNKGTPVRHQNYASFFTFNPFCMSMYFTPFSVALGYTNRYASKL